MPNYAIYARKSCESEDRQVLSIDSQIKELRNLASQRGLNIIKIFRESCSAKEPGRPIFAELMTKIQSGGIKGVVCWKLDRLARNPIEGANLIWALTKRKLHEIVMPGRAFTGSSDDKLLMSIEFGMATKYIDDLSENVKRGNRNKLEQGWRPGPAPLGYLNDKLTRTIIPDPERFHLVRRIWDMVLSGHSVPDISETANNQWGLRTRLTKRAGGRPLTQGLIYQILANAFYMGVLIHECDSYQGAHKPMITQGEFDTVQNILRRSTSNRRPKTYNWPYTGFIHCGACGRMVTAEKRIKKNSGKQYVYYHCGRGRPQEGRCTQPSVTVEVLERQLVSFIKNLFVPPKFFSWALSRIKGELVNRKKLEVKAAEMLNQTRKRTEQELHNLTTLRLRDQIDEQEYLVQRQRILGEQSSLKSKTASPVKAEETVGFEPTIRLFSFLKQADNVIGNGNAHQKRKIFAAIASNPTLKDGKLLVSAKKPFSMMSKMSKIPIWWTILEDVRTYLVEHPHEVVLPEGPWLSEPLEKLLEEEERSNINRKCGSMKKNNHPVGRSNPLLALPAPPIRLLLSAHSSKSNS